VRRVARPGAASQYDALPVFVCTQRLFLERIALPHAVRPLVHLARARLKAGTD
jgi:hypothetical protein